MVNWTLVALTGLRLRQFCTDWFGLLHLPAAPVTLLFVANLYLGIEFLLPRTHRAFDRVVPSDILTIFRILKGKTTASDALTATLPQPPTFVGEGKRSAALGCA